MFPDYQKAFVLVFCWNKLFWRYFGVWKLSINLSLSRAFWNTLPSFHGPIFFWRLCWGYAWDLRPWRMSECVYAYWCMTNGNWTTGINWLDFGICSPCHSFWKEVLAPWQSTSQEHKIWRFLVEKAVCLCSHLQLLRCILPASLSFAFPFCCNSWGLDLPWLRVVCILCRLAFMHFISAWGLGKLHNYFFA